MRVVILRELRAHELPTRGVVVETHHPARVECGPGRHERSNAVGHRARLVRLVNHPRNHQRRGVSLGGGPGERIRRGTRAVFARAAVSLRHVRLGHRQVAALVQLLQIRVRRGGHAPRAHGERRVSAEKKSARRDVEHEDEDGHHREDATQLGVAGEFETAAETQGVVERAAASGGAEGRSARVGSMQAGCDRGAWRRGPPERGVELAVRVALVVFRLVGGTGVPRVAVGAGTAIAGLAAALRGVRRGRAAATLQRARARLASRATERAAHLGGEVHEAALGGGPGREGTSSSSWTRRGGCPPDSPRRASMDSSPPRSARAHAAAVRSVDDAISREPPPGRTPGGREEEEASASRANAERRAITEVDDPDARARLARAGNQADPRSAPRGERSFGCR